MSNAISKMVSEVKWDRKTALSLAATVITVGLAIYMIARITFLAPPTPGDESRKRTAIDSVSGEVFVDYGVPDGVALPWKNPKTGKNTLFPAEKCFWTKDGKAKTKPTYVLLNEVAGREGATTCPDCGRPVVAHNPTPPVELMAEAAKAGR